MLDEVICQYCGEKANLVTGKLIYCGRFPAANKRLFYKCFKCDAYVGASPDGKPFGSLANRRLRLLRIKAHKLFDKLWRENIMSRSSAYKWLMKNLIFKMLMIVI